MKDARKQICYTFPSKINTRILWLAKTNHKNPNKTKWGKNQSESPLILTPFCLLNEYLNFFNIKINSISKQFLHQ